ncbi:AMP-binding protein [Desulfocicer niacini]
MHKNKNKGIFACELEAMAEEDPGFSIITFENGTTPEEVLTYGDIVIKGRKMAGVLQKKGIGRGDTVAVVMRNSPEFLYTLYAVTALGAILVPIDPRSKGGKLSFQLADSKARGVVFSAEFEAQMAGSLLQLPDLQTVGVVCKEGMDASILDNYPSLQELLDGPEVPPVDNFNDDLQLPMEIIYTSGTTGNPKGVVMKPARLSGMAQMARGIWRYQSDDKLYTGLSLTHGNAQAVTLIPSLYLKIPSVISAKFTKSRLWEVCRKYGCTSFSLLGGMMVAIYSELPKSDDADNPVRLVLSAGTPRLIWKKFEERFNVAIHEWYGAVEGGFAHNPPGVGPVGSFGKPISGLMEMKVVREDETECETGEIGQLVSRTVGQKPEVQYLGKEETSKAKTRGGWLRSGDMCHTDKDGWFYFDYRKGGGLRRAGDFIMPEHVESVLAEHDDVSDVCVYGIPSSTGAPGESDVVAAVVLNNNSAVNPKSLFEICLERLDRNSVPSFIQIVQGIPKTASEKNLDRFLKQDFREDADNIFKSGDYLR